LNQRRRRLAEEREGGSRNKERKESGVDHREVKGGKKQTGIFESQTG